MVKKDYYMVRDFWDTLYTMSVQAVLRQSNLKVSTRKTGDNL